MIIKREIEQHVSRLATQYPIVTLTGPRQSGKTTLARSLFPRKPYLSMENLDIRRQATQDPNAFLKTLPDGAILDEIQKAPELLSYLQTRVDLAGRAGQFILTGSAQLQVMANVSQTLAGRTALATLLPFTMAEAYPERRTMEAEKVLYTGFYPRLFDKQLNPTEALAAYHATYVERDVRDLLKVRDWSRFDTFVRLCAARTANLLKLDGLANEAGVNHGTAEQWLSTLEASYLAFRLRPHHNSLSKRLVKMPKLHFVDCGLAAYLMQIENERHAAHHPQRGALFETMVVAELLKQRLNQIKPSNIYFWRDHTGHEIDALYDFGDAVLPVEIKAAQTLSDDFFKDLNYYRRINPRCRKAVLVYGGDRSFVDKDTWILSFRDLPRLAAVDHTLRFE